MNCAKCGQPIIPASTAVSFRSKPYHPVCFAKVKEQAKNKNAQKAAVVNDPALQQLTDYLCKLFSLSELTPLLRKQLEDLHNQKGYSWQNILFAVRYWFELGEGADEEPEQASLGIIPFVYDEAVQFFKTVELAKEHNASFTPKNQTTVYRYESKSSPAPSSCNMEDL